VQRILGKIHEQTARDRTYLTAEAVVLEINRALRGWANYFKLGPVARSYCLIDRYTTDRLRRWLRCKRPGARLWTSETLYRDLGLVCLPRLTRKFPWATS
jgi:hypothetical protein